MIHGIMVWKVRVYKYSSGRGGSDIGKVFGCVRGPAIAGIRRNRWETVETMIGESERNNEHMSERRRSEKRKGFCEG